MSTSATKAAEQARLSELFKLLASRRPRSASFDTDASMNEPVQDGLDPILQRIVGARDIETRPRRNTVASILTHARQTSNLNASSLLVWDEGSDSEGDSDDGSLSNFPLAAAAKYPFTFKLMIYKLYKKDDWAKTIKQMLEKSKNEFKPLAEQEDMVYVGTREAEENSGPKDVAAVRFKLPIRPRARRRSVVGRRDSGSSVTNTRQRSPSVTAATSLWSARPAVGYPRSPFPKSPAVAEEPEARVLKKRCVGRRKSTSGPLNENAGNIRGTWVYNAAVSVSERPAAASFASFPPGPPPSPTAHCHSAADRPMVMGPKRMPGHLGVEAGMQRRVSEGGPMMVVPMMMPLGQITNKDSLVARRRARALDATENDRTGGRKAAKRPLAD